MIPRLHLFELEDLPWFPATIRDFGTDYIHFVEDRFRLYAPIVPLLARGLREAGTTRVIDLCSGGGGPWRALVRELRSAGVAAEVVLTDRFPNLRAFEHVAAGSSGQITYFSKSVDARQVPPELLGFRTICNAFHHFRPERAREMLAAAAKARQPIGVFEIPDRRLITILPMLLTPLAIWLFTPFIRPFSWRRLLFTYLIPVVPLYCLWDGLVSQLRAYRPDELRSLVQGIDDSFDWRAGQTRLGWGPVRLTWLIGSPRTRPAATIGQGEAR